MAKFAAKGTIFKWTISSVLTTVAQVTSISLTRSNGAIDTTDLSDTTRNNVLSIPDNGDVELECVCDAAAATYVALEADFAAATQRVANIAYAHTSTKTYSFTAGITNLAITAREGDACRFTVAMKVSGAVTIS